MLEWRRFGAGPDIVLVHGFLGSGETFEPLTRHLQQKFTVTTIDLPGFGDSFDIPVPPSVEDLSLMVAECIESSGIRKCSVLGPFPWGHDSAGTESAKT